MFLLSSSPSDFFPIVFFNGAKHPRCNSYVRYVELAVRNVNQILSSQRKTSSNDISRPENNKAVYPNIVIFHFKC